MPQRIHTTELLRRFSAGDEAAYQCLYDRYRRPLLGFIRCHTDSALRALLSEEDLLQEAHVAAWQGLESFTYRRELAFFFWLCGIARRLIYNHCRRLRRQPPPLSFLSAIPGSLSSSDLLRTLCSTGASPFERLQLQQQLELLAVALEGLREVDRQAILLRYVEGWSGPEVAVRLGLRPGAFRVRLSRALVRLRAIFDELLATAGSEQL